MCVSDRSAPTRRQPVNGAEVPCAVIDGVREHLGETSAFVVERNHVRARHEDIAIFQVMRAVST